LPEQEQGQEKSSELIDSSLYVDAKLIKEWQKFDSIISNLRAYKDSAHLR